MFKSPIPASRGMRLERLRKFAYDQLNGPPFLNQKYAMRHHFSTAQTLVNDIRQALPLRDARYYKPYEQRIVMGTLFFSVSSICNAKCVFCAYKDGKGPKGNMPFETFKKAADEYASMGGKVISFTPTVGDPLVDPGLLKKIHYAVSLPGIERVLFYTNGIALPKNDLYRKLIDSGIQDLRISMAETEREGYNRIYGVKAYDVMINGVHKLLQYNRECGEPVAVSINFRSSKGPQDVLDSPDFKQYIAPYLSGRVMYDFINDYDNWGGTIKEEDLEGVMRMRRIPRMKRMPCIKTFDLMVLFNGAVRLCACRFVETEFDELIVGNIHQESLRDIFYGSRVAALREAFVDNTLPPVCATCSLYQPATVRWLERRARNERTYHLLPFAEPASRKQRVTS